MKKGKKGDLVKARLREALFQKDLSQSELARRMGKTQSTVANWLGGSLPRERMLLELTLLLDVSKEWLVDGVGPMRMSREQRMLTEERLRGGGTLVSEVVNTYGRGPAREDGAHYRVRGELEKHELKEEELHAWRDIQLLRQEIELRMIEAVTDRREEAAKRLKQRLEEYLEVCAGLRPQAGQFMKEELKRELDHRQNNL